MVYDRTSDIISYLFSWTNTLILKPSSIAILSLTSFQYFLSDIMKCKLAFVNYCPSCTCKFIFRLWTSGRTGENGSYFCSSYMHFCFSIISSCFIYLFTVMLININSISVSTANRLNIVLVMCKTLTILTVIIAGLVRIGQGLLMFYMGTLLSFEGILL